VGSVGANRIDPQLRLADAALPRIHMAAILHLADSGPRVVFLLRFLAEQTNGAA